MGEWPPPAAEVGETRNFDGTASAVCRRWAQTFAKEYPEQDANGQDVMKAIHMPFARWMYVKNKWMRGKWGWGCDMCSCELTLTHLQSGRHTRSTRNEYRIPNCQVDFSGPSFDQGREIPAAPGGVNRVLFPNGWQWPMQGHREGVFPPG